MKGISVITLLLLFPALAAFATDHYTNKKKLSHFILPDDTTKVAPADTASDDEDVKHRKYEFSLEGASDQSHYGLSNNVKIPYIEPSFTYTAKSGFYIEVGDKDVLIKKGGGFDEFNLNPGWDFDVTDNTTLNLNYTFYHYKPGSSVLIKSTMISTLEGYAEQDLGNLSGKLTLDYNIYKGKATPNDVAITPDLSYLFDWDISNKCELTVTPEANMDFGTRNFYTQYQNNLSNDSTTINPKHRKIQYAPKSNSSFGVLDYNLLLTVEFRIGKFSIEPAITYTRSLYTPPNTPSVPPLTYGSITLNYTVKGKK
jgi:hypothetical protein